MRREAMKLLIALVPWFLLAASIVSFALGRDWDRKGNLNHELGHREQFFSDLGDAFCAVGQALECVGVVGGVLALGLFGMKFHLKTLKKRIQELEKELHREQISELPSRSINQGTG
jgi:hypothetical protein